MSSSRLPGFYKMKMAAQIQVARDSTVAPLRALKTAGPQSGRQKSSLSFSASPSYWPRRMSARFRRFGLAEAAS